MKNFKTNEVKGRSLLAIIVLTALIVIGITGCPDEPAKKLKLNNLKVFTYYGTSSGAYAGKPITAQWSGDETVKCEWFLDDVSVSTTTTCTPSAAGTLKLVVEAENKGYKPLEKTITVLALTEVPHLDYLGKWTMDYTKSENSAWKNSDQLGGNFNEYVTITEDEYYLRCEKKSLKDGVDTEGFFRYTITTWTAAVSDSTVDSTFKKEAGFKLTGAVAAEHGGYNDPIGGFLIYLKTTVGYPPTQVSDRNNIKRYYERRLADNIQYL